MEIFKKYTHNPPHLFKGYSKYFITVATYRRKDILKPDIIKLKLLEEIENNFQKYNWGIDDWVILDNHYHLMSQAPKNSQELPFIFRDIHRQTSHFIKKINKKKTGEKCFHNYWDTCITFQNSYFARLNYIFYNPVKHGYVKDAKDYKWGSYYYRYKYQKDYLLTLRKTYKWDMISVPDSF